MAASGAVRKVFGVCQVVVYFPRLLAMLVDTLPTQPMRKHVLDVLDILKQFKWSLILKKYPWWTSCAGSGRLMIPHKAFWGVFFFSRWSCVSKTGASFKTLKPSNICHGWQAWVKVTIVVPSTAVPYTTSMRSNDSCMRPAVLPMSKPWRLRVRAVVRSPRRSRRPKTSQRPGSWGCQEGTWFAGKKVLWQLCCGGSFVLSRSCLV